MQCFTTVLAATRAVQAAYKQELMDAFGISFNNLFCLNNMPIKRYVDYLQRRNKLEEYMQVSLYIQPRNACMYSDLQVTAVLFDSCTACLCQSGCTAVVVLPVLL